MRRSVATLSLGLVLALTATAAMAAERPYQPAPAPTPSVQSGPVTYDPNFTPLKLKTKQVTPVAVSLPAGSM